MSPSDRTLNRNTLWNLGGMLAPVPAALLALPLLVKGLGLERFGLLTIAWAVLGYFSLFDLGIGRALTQQLAERLGSDREKEAPPLVWTSLALLAGLGALGTAAILLLSGWLAGTVLTVAPGLEEEAARSLRLLALSVPLVTVTAGLRGVLEARQRFDAVNLVRVPMGVFLLAGPVAVLPFTRRLDAVMAVLLAGRFLFLAAHAALCARALPGLAAGAAIDASQARLLLRSGSWMTVSNIVSPLMTNLDRFFVGALVSVQAAGFYATPQEMMLKVSLIPAAIVGVLFPAFAAGYRRDRSRARLLFGRGLAQVALALAPLTLAACAFARPGLTWWLGGAFAEQGTRVLQVLSVGVLINGLAYLPFALIQGAGRPDLTGKLHLALTPVYFAMFLPLVRHWGIQGAALAWTGRVTIEACFLFAFAFRLLRDGEEPAVRLEPELEAA